MIIKQRETHHSLPLTIRRAAALLTALSMIATTPAAAFAEPQEGALGEQTTAAQEAAEAVNAAAAEGENPASEAPAADAQAENPDGENTDDGAPAADTQAENPDGENPDGGAPAADAQAENPDGGVPAADAQAENPDGQPVPEETTAPETEAPAAALPPMEEALSLIIDHPDLIAYGVTVGSIPIGGMTVEEAQAAVSAHFQGIADSILTVNVNGQPVQTPVSSLGYEWSLGESINEAASIGKSGGLVTRYRELTDAYCDGDVHEIKPAVNADAVNAFVGEQIIPLNVEPQNASIHRENDDFVITPEVYGIVTDQQATVDTILWALASETPETTVDSVSTVTPPALLSEQLSTIHDLLGAYSTPIIDDSSGRVTNLKVASGRLNGVVMMPGDQVSVSTTILPRNEANGYRKGTMFNNGNSEPAIGGGVCQVSTTLYGALLRAEMQIDERHPHSMVIRYSPYSTDAAIASGSKDLVFTNNQATPVYIEGYVKGGRLYFNLYGQETRPANRTIEFKSVTVSKRNLEDKVVYSSSYPTGYRRSSGSRHAEVSSYLDKIVYVDGVEVSRERVNTDHYDGSRVTVVVGTKQAAPATPAATEAPAAAEG